MQESAPGTVNPAQANQLAEKAVAAKNGTHAMEKVQLTNHKSVVALVESMKNQIARALPKHITPERMIRTVLTQLRTNPALMECKPETVLGSLMAASQVGLEPGPLGLCYLIPYRNKGILECQFQIGYKGLKELAHRSGQVANIGAYAIRKQDEYALQYGTDGKFFFKPNITWDGDAKDNPVVVYVSYIRYKNGSESYLHMTPKEIERVRDRYSKNASYDSSPWRTEPEAMGLKTVIKRHLKLERLSPEEMGSLAMDGAIVKARTDAAIDTVTSFEDIVTVQAEESLD